MHIFGRENHLGGTEELGQAAAFESLVLRRIVVHCSLPVSKGETVLINSLVLNWDL